MSKTEANEYVEYVACKVSDFNENHVESMKEVELGDVGKCLLIKHKDGEITAIGNKCTHYGAPLIKGVLSGNRVRCPWHGACFNTKTGDIEDFPGLDNLHVLKVSLKDGDVIVSASKQELENHKRNALLEKSCHAFSTKDTLESYRVVIIGGGPSSVTCAETLRKDGFNGQITIISKDIHPPYDRPKLSKALDVEPEKIYLRSGVEYFKTIGVELCLNTEVLSVDVLTKTVQLSKPLPHTSSNGGVNLKYDSLVIATGGEPRTLKPAPGWNLKHVYVLRTPSDANAIAEVSKGKQVVIVGSSFIGMEVASFLASKNIAASVSVICGKRSSVPFESSLGEEVGGIIMKLHQQKGSVTFYSSVGVESLSSKNESSMVSHVNLSDGSVIEADVVVVGIGVTPATSFLKGSEIRMTNEGYIAVDGRMQTKVPHVYAVGDIALFPLRIKGGALTNIQHWQMAHTHGKLAALNIMQCAQRTSKGFHKTMDISASERDVLAIPFFWTVQFGMSIRYAGLGTGFEKVIVCGDKDNFKFAAYYLIGKSVVAVATLNTDPIAAKFAELLRAGNIVDEKDISKLST